MTQKSIACPNCGRLMERRDRHGVRIDLCTGCRGVWLDRGELDTIIERSSRFLELPVPQKERRGHREAITRHAFDWF